MEETKGRSLCKIAGIVGIIAAILGCVAEVKKVQDKDIVVDTINNVCVYPKSSAAILGFVSALVQVIAFIIVNYAGGCFCRYKGNRCQCSAALVFFILSWLTFVAGLFLLVRASVVSLITSGKMTRLQKHGDNPYCYNGSPAIFAYGAFLSVISIYLGKAYYRMLAPPPPRIQEDLT